MKTLVMSLLLLAACECAGQGIITQPYIPDTTYDCRVRLITPAGRFVGWAVERRGDGIIQRDSVVKTGCPVCGNHESRAVFMIAGLVGFRLEGVEQVYACTPCGTLYTGRQRK